MPRKRAVIQPKGVEVSLFNAGNENDALISLTDIAKYKNPEAPADIIKNWMRSRSTIEYLGLWEQMYNTKFNNSAYTELLTVSGSNSFVLSPKKWIEETNAIGIVSKSGRYGGTYARTDIAFEFAMWVSAEFRLYLVKDYQQLKEKESDAQKLEWDVRRELAKVNYKIHTDAVKENLIPEQLTKSQVAFKYATEADRLNMALFGMTARQWKLANPQTTGNIRDNATVIQLTVLTNLESMNAELLKAGVGEEERTQKLNKMAREQMKVLLTNREKQKDIEKGKGRKELE
ncbi:KilA-N domain-containing protein [Lacticaseibacillus parahuelsenbergensis]|uniref:KilA-N domain-containing protein n=1 Tax=Lacticaseibacillus parahuelsenbergensis TaxID=3068305 RepID=A0ABY9L3M9_9LACO|nr:MULTISPECIES: KilA-N domain-containing protein [Lacticaseibacillus]MDE3281100.1 KilA-N domain-containing protein [Lacticaseibacillus casei]WLV78030.1 KilA-N domain-containing protein [Lacticaseibacillus sp. NCIMB 15471]